MTTSVARRGPGNSRAEVVASGPARHRFDRREQDAAELWAGSYSCLAGWCAELVGDDEVGREIASEAFVRLLTRWRRPRDPRLQVYVIAARLAFRR